MAQVWIIDSYGYWTGEMCFVAEVRENMVTVPMLIGYVKPLWTGTEWVEGATQEEIQAWKDSQQIDICSEPTDRERIEQLEIDKAALAENVYMLAEIIESLIGGEEDGQEDSTTEITTD